MLLWVSYRLFTTDARFPSKALLSSPFRAIDSKVGWTVTSLEVVNSIRSSALRSMPLPSAIVTAVIRYL